MAYDPFAFDPFSNIFDPYRGNDRSRDPFRSIFPSPAPVRNSRPSTARFPPFDDTEANALIDDILDKATSGLGYVAETLDKPGRAMRGLLSGDVGAVANLIPFSDTLGITDPGDSVSGRDLLEKAGVLNRNTTGLDFGDVAGFGVEVVTDPLTFLGVGALTQAGKAAKAGGTLAKGAKAGVQAGHRAPLQLGALGKTIDFGIGGGQQIDKFFGGVDTLADKARYAPGIRHARSLLSKPVEGVTDPTLQRFLDETNAPELFRRRKGEIGEQSQAIRREFHESVMQDPTLIALQKQYDESVAANPAFKQQQPIGPLETTERLMRLGVDQIDYTVSGNGDIFVRGPQDITSAPGQPIQFGGTYSVPLADSKSLSMLKMLAPNAYQKSLDIADKVFQHQSDFKQAADQLGVNTGDLIDTYAKYSHRSLRAHSPGQFVKNMRRLLSTKDASGLSRKEVLKNVPGGTDTLDQIAMDPKISSRDSEIWSQVQLPGFAKKQNFQSAFKEKDGLAAAEQYVLDNYLGGVEHYDGQAKKLAKWARELDPSHAAKKTPFFDGPLKDFARRGVYQAKTLTAADVRLEAIKRFAKEADALDANENAMTVKEFLQRSNLGKTETIEVNGKDVTVMKALGELAARGMGAPGGDIASMVIPESLAQPMLKYLAGWTQPEEIRGIAKLYDSVLGLTSDWLTATWPAFHTRNTVSNLYQNWVSEAFDPEIAASSPLGKMDPRAYIHPVKEIAWGVASGKPIKPIAGFHSQAAMQEAAADLAAGGSGVSTLASKELYDVMAAHDIGFTNRASAASETIGGGAAIPDAAQFPDPNAKFLDQFVKTSGMKDVSTMFRAAKNRDWKTAASAANVINPLAAQRFTGGEDKFFGFRIGRAAGNYIESATRGGHFVAKLKQNLAAGMPREEAIAQARQSVRDWHYGYDPETFTQFERSVAKRVFPFYSFMSQNLPRHIEELVTRPGGRMGQTVRAIDSGRKDAGFIPEYIGEGAAFSLGGDRFITGFGLPVEAAFENLSVSGDPLKAIGRTLEKTLGATSPAVKLPYSAMSGRDPFFGRDLDEIYPYPTESKATNLLLSNSPASRAISSVRTIGDPRKDLLARTVNLASGVKLHDVSGGLERQKQIEAGRVVAELLKDQPNIRDFERLYADPKAVSEGKVTPEEELLLRLSETIVRRRRDAAEERRQAETGVTMRDVLAAAGK